MSGLRRTQAGAAVPVTIVQKKIEAGPAVPVEFQGDFAEPGDITAALNAHDSSMSAHAYIQGLVRYASNAEAVAKAVTDKALTPANLAAAGVLPKALTDYTNVVVVDGGGNGDYTTLNAALAAITDAAADKRYAILLFGNIAEAGDLTFKDYVDVIAMTRSVVSVSGAHTINFPCTVATYFKGVRFVCSFETGAINIGAAPRFYECEFYGSLATTASGAVFTRSVIDAAFSIAAGHIVTIEQCSGNIVDSIATYGIAVSGELYLIDSHFVDNLSLWGANGLLYVANGGSLHGRRSSVIADGSTALNLAASASCDLDKFTARTLNNSSRYGLNITMTPTSFLAVGCYFEGSSGKAARASSAYSNAPFYQCQFKGGVTNITAAAGTAVGTNVSF